MTVCVSSLYESRVAVRYLKDLRLKARIHENKVLLV
jgi:hypothetical protein